MLNDPLVAGKLRELVFDSENKLILSGNYLDPLSLEQVQAFADVIKNAPNLTKLDLRCNQLDKWSLEKVRAFADAIKNAPNLTTLDLSGNSLGNWSPEQLQAFADAIKNALHLITLDFIDDFEPNLNFKQIQAFIDAIRDNFSLCSVNNGNNRINIQSLLDRNKKIQTQILQWKIFFNTPISEKTTEQVPEEIHTQLLALEEILTAANTPSANKCLTRLANIRFDAFNLGLSHQSFIDCYGWVLDCNHQFIPLDEHQQKIFDSALLTAVGSDLPINNKLSVEQRLTLLQYLFINLHNLDVPTSSHYSPTFYSPVPDQPISDGTLKGAPMASILEQSDAINKQFEALPKEYKNTTTL